ncbi:hypothetical protein [Streptomyces sp. NPDC048644]|uniref:hypothetical protein n=1 Tax=Streptomyces sp. NPDC048644 TaxID=3365582 RepID=UPI00371053D4
MEWHPSANGVKLINKCKKTWTAKVVNGWWPDTGCQHIRPGHSWCYKSPTKIGGIKNC